jgi:hypothetical protein
VALLGGGAAFAAIEKTDAHTRPRVRMPGLDA